MAISRKFEIYVEKTQVSRNEEVERYLFPFIRNCFPSESSPRAIDDGFILGKEREKEEISKRIVYGIREMFYILCVFSSLLGLELISLGRLWKLMDVLKDWLGGSGKQKMLFDHLKVQLLDDTLSALE